MNKILFYLLVGLALPVLGADYAKFDSVNAKQVTIPAPSYSLIATNAITSWGPDSFDMNVYITNSVTGWWSYDCTAQGGEIVLSDKTSSVPPTVRYPRVQTPSLTGGVSTAIAYLQAASPGATSVVTLASSVDGASWITNNTWSIEGSLWVTSTVNSVTAKYLRLEKISDSGASDRRVVVDDILVYDYHEFGLVASSVGPTSSNEYDLGSASMPWRDLYVGHLHGVTDVATLSVQDPTNGLIYWMANPYPSSTVVELIVKSHGMTGSVDIVWQNWNSLWYSTNTIQNSVSANGTGTLVTSFANSGALTNRTRVGFVPNNLSSFAPTNMLSVDLKLSVP